MMSTKGFDQNDIAKTIGKVRAAGINVIGNFIFGLPEDNLSSMEATLDLAVELNCEFANFYVAMAYPGSQLYNDAIRKNWSLPETWNGYSQHAVTTLPLPTKYLSAAEVLRFRDEAFQVYFKNPNYLAMISRKFGPRNCRAHWRNGVPQAREAISQLRMKPFKRNLNTPGGSNRLLKRSS